MRPMSIAEAALLRKLRAKRGIIFRNHSVATWQSPLCPVCVSAQAMREHQVALQDLYRLPTLEANQVIGKYRSWLVPPDQRRLGRVVTGWLGRRVTEGG